MKTLLILLLRGYRAVISPIYGQVCRYYPSCSAYALESVQVHGALRGSWLALRRIGRCHPWTLGGVDLVPSPQDYRWWGVAPGYDDEDRPTDHTPECEDRHDMMGPSAERQHAGSLGRTAPQRQGA